MYGSDYLKGVDKLTAFLVILVVSIVLSFTNIVLFIPLAWLGLELLQRFEFLSSFKFLDVLLVSIFFHLFVLFNMISIKFYKKAE